MGRKTPVEYTIFFCTKKMAFNLFEIRVTHPLSFLVCLRESTYNSMLFSEPEKLTIVRLFLFF